MHSLNSRVVAAVVVVILGGGIAGSAVLGYWQTESDRVPTRFSTGEYAGLSNPGDIRGSYSFEDVATAFSVPVEALAAAFGVSAHENPGAITASSLESLFIGQPDGGEVGTDAVRLFVSLYAGLPYEAEDTTRLPDTAFPILSVRLAPADRAVLEQRIVPLEALLGAGVTVESLSTTNQAYPTVTASDEHDDSSPAVRGRTTFNDLLSWGLTKEEIEETIGIPMGVRAANVRDTITAAGLEFGTYRDRLQLLLDSHASPVGE